MTNDKAIKLAKLFLVDSYIEKGTILDATLDKFGKLQYIKVDYNGHIVEMQVYREYDARDNKWYNYRGDTKIDGEKGDGYLLRKLARRYGDTI